MQGRGGPEPPARSVEDGVPQGSAWFGFCCFSELLHGFSLFHLFLTLVFSTPSLLKLVCWYLYRSLRRYLCLRRSIPTEPVYSIHICICRYMYISYTCVCIYENKIPSLTCTHHTQWEEGHRNKIKWAQLFQQPASLWEGNGLNYTGMRDPRRVHP